MLTQTLPNQSLVKTRLQVLGENDVVGLLLYIPNHRTPNKLDSLFQLLLHLSHDFFGAGRWCLGYHEAFLSDFVLDKGYLVFEY